jgi:uncharacterized DUF497 family protein
MHGIAFEWDRKKDSANLLKHGVGFAEASTVFDDPLSITIPALCAKISEPPSRLTFTIEGGGSIRAEFGFRFELLLKTKGQIGFVS